MSDSNYIKGVDKSCPTGDQVHDWWTTNTTATHYTGQDVINEAGQCQDCAPNLVCVDTYSTYCYGKDPYNPVFDANNGAKLLQVEDRRVAQYSNQVCFDCNHEELSAGSCAFASDYFPDHGLDTTYS